MDYDVLCVGDAIVDAFITIKNADEHSHETEQRKEICFTAGAKIPVDDCQFRLGGNACNVSVGLSRLGMKTALVAETGDDEFALKIIKGLQDEKVSLEFFKQTKNAPATFAISIAFMHDRTILSRHVTRDHAIDFERASTVLVYLTSVGDVWRPLYQKVLQYVKNHHAKLVFNPGSRQLKEGKESFIDILSETKILFCNKEEAETIVYGTEEVAEELRKPDVLLRGLQKIGPRIVSITDGDKGSFAIDATGTIYTQGIVPSNFVQKTGVGDAYASGFLGNFLYNQDIQQAMLSGAMNAASVIEHVGAQPGLLTKAQLEGKLERV